MPKKGNGQALTNDLLSQMLVKLGSMEKGLNAVREGLDGVQREQQAMRKEQETMRVELQRHGQRLESIEEGVRKIAAFVGEDKLRQDHDIEAIKNRIDALERRAA